jgi:hypothetical protein
MGNTCRSGLTCSLPPGNAQPIHDFRRGRRVLRSRNDPMDSDRTFRVGDKESRREDDHLDTFCYWIVIALGDTKGF